MACEASLQRFCTATAAREAVAAALGDGEPAAAAAALHLLADIARTRAEQALRARGTTRSAPEHAADLRAMAGCTTLFSAMADQQIVPPVHGTPKPGAPFALPRDLAAQYGYAALAETLGAIEHGQPLPELAGEIVASRRAMQDAAATPPPAGDPLAALSARERQRLDEARAERLALRRLHQLAGLANTMLFGPARAAVMREAGLALLAHRENTGGGSRALWSRSTTGTSATPASRSYASWPRRR